MEELSLITITNGNNMVRAFNINTRVHVPLHVPHYISSIFLNFAMEANSFTASPIFSMEPTTSMRKEAMLASGMT